MVSQGFVKVQKRRSLKNIWGPIYGGPNLLYLRKDKITHDIFPRINLLNVHFMHIFACLFLVQRGLCGGELSTIDKSSHVGIFFPTWCFFELIQNWKTEPYESTRPWSFMPSAAHCPTLLQISLDAKSPNIFSKIQPWNGQKAPPPHVVASCWYSSWLQVSLFGKEKTIKRNVRKTKSLPAMTRVFTICLL